MFTKPNALLYIRRNGLIIAGKHIAPARLTFPASVFSDLEIVNPDKFIDLTQAFFKEHGLHAKRILAVLDTSVVFEKAVELDKSGKPDAILAGFVDAMPFEPGQRSCIGVRADNELHLYATNAELCEAIQDAIKQAGAGHLLAMTPAAAYGLPSDQALSSAVAIFIADTAVRGHADLASVDPV